MTSHRESGDVTDISIQEEEETVKPEKKDIKDMSELPPIGTSLHKRRRGEPPATLSVKSPQTPSDAEGSSPCTAGPTPEEWMNYGETPDAQVLCDSMLQRLKGKNDPLSRRGKDLAQRTKDTFESLDQLEKLLELLDHFVALKEENSRILGRLKDVNHYKRLHNAHKRIDRETERVKSETRELELINEALDADCRADYFKSESQVLFDSMIMGGRSMKRSGSKWKGHSKFGGSLLRKQRSRSAGGDESDVPGTPGSPLRRRSEVAFAKEVEKSKVSKWTRVKAAFRWEKAQWPPVGGAASAVAAGAMVGAVALAGSTPTTATLSNPEPRDSASLTPGSALSMTPNSSCEELRMEGTRKGIRCEDSDNTFLQAPMQDDSSTSPSPNKLHKTPWGKMRDILQTHRESVKKKSHRGSKSSPDIIPKRRRSLSDGGDSDAPPALTLTIPSSEELESEPSHSVLRKQRSLELGARPPQHRPPRASKWTKVKRAFLTSASASVPSSPSRHSAFFTDAETEGLSSGGEAIGMKEDIARNYAALQSRLRQEFSDRRDMLSFASRPVATEEQLSADFRKKLTEWQLKKGMKSPLPVPARQDLSEDFLKKWDEWKRMKDTNSVPAWEREAKPDEVLVQTSTGLFKFQGISRSFTRKLHEWEKSRGIAPEASTSALLRAAKSKTKDKKLRSPLTRTQSDGSVAPSAGGAERHTGSSLSVNDVDDFESEYERDHSLDGADECDSPDVRGAVLVEVEAEEVCTAAPLMAVSPKHTPQKPIYTYGQAEARLLCETSSAVTGTAILQPSGAVLLSDTRKMKAKESLGARPKSREQKQPAEKSRKMMNRQTSIEDDAMFIRKAIEEVERGSSSRFREVSDVTDTELRDNKSTDREICITNKDIAFVPLNHNFSSKDKLDGKEKETEDTKYDKPTEKTNGRERKKSKSRARLEREQSKPSESDTENDVDTVTVEIPRRKKRPRRASEKPRTPPTSLHSDTEEEIFVLKLKAPEQRDHSPEVIVKTTRKIFSPVVRSGETVPRAVIPVDVEDLDDVRPITDHRTSHSEAKTKDKPDKAKPEKTVRSKSSGDIEEGVDLKKCARPPLPSSPSSQRKPQPKETAPSIRIMIQRYNKKINEDGHTSGPSSGASSPAWRSPSTERRRPPDMPVGVNIRNNPFLEREVQKSASACQLSRRDQTLSEKRLAPTPSTSTDGVLKSHSANALHPEQSKTEIPTPSKIEDSQETIRGTASTDTIVPDLSKHISDNQPPKTESLPVLRQMSDTTMPNLTRLISENRAMYGRSISTVDPPTAFMEFDTTITKLSERAAKIKAARERFLSSTVPMRREGTSSASDLRPGDRSSRVSCESDVTESNNTATQESNLGRSASTGMVNVDREAWQRVAEGNSRGSRTRSKFSLVRLAAKIRRKDEGAVTRLCRQSLLVQLMNKH